ncbi:transmembrane protein 235-like isoform X2 [Danio rerio]|uniref:Transmembrane protein 235-like isoform X2 n=1 Tax=Danio rerio TaxID=7955 RepID=A0AC58I7H6_DANRE
MKMNFGSAVVAAGLCGLMSFILLAVSIATEYWYIIDVDEGKNSSLEYSSSHSGLWRIYEGPNGSYHDISFYTDTSQHTEQEKHLLDLHRVIVVLLPLSLVLLVFGGIFALVASLTQSCSLLICISVYFLICNDCILVLFNWFGPKQSVWCEKDPKTALALCCVNYSYPDERTLKQKWELYSS